MTAGFPLSISDHFDAHQASPTTPPLDDPRDGFVRLRRRDESRLWFRRSDPTAPVEMRLPAPAPAPAPALPAKSAENPGTDKLVSEMVRVVQAGRSSLIDVIDAAAGHGPTDLASTVAATPMDARPTTPMMSPPAASEATTSSEKIEWRAVQAGAPVLLLSAGPVLESSRPGPILGPGMRYRITGMTGSVVAMEVMHANGDRRSGYANAVDLRCIEPKIHTGGLQTERGLTGRLRLTKLATTTFGLFGG